MCVGRSDCSVGDHIGPLVGMWETVPTSQRDLPRRIKKTLVMWEPIQDSCLGRGRRFPHPLHGSGPGPGPGPGAAPTPPHPTQGPVSVPTSPVFFNTSGKVPLGCGNRFPGPNHSFAYVYGQGDGSEISIFEKV